MHQPLSPWLDDRTWQHRLVRDRALLDELLDDDEQREFVRGVVPVANGGEASSTSSSSMARPRAANSTTTPAWTSTSKRAI